MDDRPCAPANPPLNWDDNFKICNYTSTTCVCKKVTEELHSSKFTEISAEPSVGVTKQDCRTTGERCIRSCSGLKDGDYQSCHNCDVYASCTNGTMRDDRPCAPAKPRLNWDDISKRCLYSSRTCRCYRGIFPLSGISNVESKTKANKLSESKMVVSKQSNSKMADINTPAPKDVSKPQCKTTGDCCIKSCAGRHNGDYQSCHGCNIYATCSNGRLIDDRQCAKAYPALKWDDNYKKCLHASSTCRCYTDNSNMADIDTNFNMAAIDTNSKMADQFENANFAYPVEVSKPPCWTTGVRCIQGCFGRQDGDYQSCHSCNVYVTCSNGKMTDDRPCARANPPLEWDNDAKSCLKTSSTCKCYPNEIPTLPVSSLVNDVDKETHPDCRSTGAHCIRSCSGRPDGDYQSCNSCNAYASCSGGILYDNRPCAPASPPLVWDDNAKRCLYSSRTCTCYKDEFFFHKWALLKKSNEFNDKQKL
jgi:hypothetical protein